MASFQNTFRNTHGISSQSSSSCVSSSFSTRINYVDTSPDNRPSLKYMINKILWNYVPSSIYNTFTLNDASEDVYHGPNHSTSVHVCDDSNDINCHLRN
jgi:hypothetical protein